MGSDDLIFWLGHASFYLKADGCTVFIDPFRVSERFRGMADLVLVTHAHFDHCSEEDIRRVMKEDAKIIAANGCLDPGAYQNLAVAAPGFSTSFKGVSVEAVPAYNIKSERLQFHPKANRWLGYVVEAQGMRIYHAGDTDLIPEMEDLDDIDAALLPVGGKFTMDVDEAIKAAGVIKPGFFVPMHYKSVLGLAGSREAESKLRRCANCCVMKELQEEPAYSF